MTGGSRRGRRFRGAYREEDGTYNVLGTSPKKVVSFKLESDLIEEIDRLCRSAGYRSRSEFLREAVIYYMQIVSRRLQGSNVIGEFNAAARGEAGYEEFLDIDESLGAEELDVEETVAGTEADEARVLVSAKH